MDLGCLSAGQVPLIACALERECSTLRRHLAHPIPVVATGFGAGRTTRSIISVLSQHRRPLFFLFAGTAGQLDPGLRIGDVVCPEKWFFESGGESPAAPPLIALVRESGLDVCGTGLTLKWPVFRKSARQTRFGQTGARVCDMEAAAALRTAAAFSVPAIAVKVVSDVDVRSAITCLKNLDRNMQQLAQQLNRTLQCFQTKQRL